ncbi:MAG: CBS domain-containing protein [Actinobacteria bacterium]|nr:CBS domain-containing protein [Actinomycetota bacterium]
MSPRAAWRLERLGFDRVYDYVFGKVDWIAAGLPTVRAPGGEPRAIDVADRDPVTCSPGNQLRDVPVGQTAIVLNDEGIVLGRVRADRSGELDRIAEDVMEPGPATVRANEPLDPLLARMERRGVAEMVVTTPEGRLLGVVRRG